MLSERSRCILFQSSYSKFEQFTHLLNSTTTIPEIAQCSNSLLQERDHQPMCTPTEHTRNVHFNQPRGKTDDAPNMSSRTFRHYITHLQDSLRYARRM